MPNGNGCRIRTNSCGADTESKKGGHASAFFIPDRIIPVAIPVFGQNLPVAPNHMIVFLKLPPAMFELRSSWIKSAVNLRTREKS